MATFVLILDEIGWMLNELIASYLNPYMEEMPRTTEAETVEQNALTEE